MTDSADVAPPSGAGRPRAAFNSVPPDYRGLTRRIVRLTPARYADVGLGLFAITAIGAAVILDVLLMGLAPTLHAYAESAASNWAHSVVAGVATIMTTLRLPVTGLTVVLLVAVFTREGWRAFVGTTANDFFLFAVDWLFAKVEYLNSRRRRAAWALIAIGVFEAVVIFYLHRARTGAALQSQAFRTWVRSLETLATKATLGDQDADAFRALRGQLGGNETAIGAAPEGVRLLREWLDVVFPPQHGLAVIDSRTRAVAMRDIEARAEVAQRAGGTADDAYAIALLHLLVARYGLNGAGDDCAHVEPLVHAHQALVHAGDALSGVAAVEADLREDVANAEGRVYACAFRLAVDHRMPEALARLCDGLDCAANAKEAYRRSADGRAGAPQCTYAALRRLNNEADLQVRVALSYAEFASGPIPEPLREWTVSAEAFAVALSAGLDQMLACQATLPPVREILVTQAQGSATVAGLLSRGAEHPRTSMERAAALRRSAAFAGIALALGESADHWDVRPFCYGIRDIDDLHIFVNGLNQFTSDARERFARFRGRISACPMPSNALPTMAPKPVAPSGNSEP